MIGNEDRCLHHLNYGLALINPALSSGDISLLFVAATQMNLGGPIAVQEKEQYAMIANYNLTAGKKAMDCSDFISGFAYFDNGMSFLRKNHWRDHYDLSLELYNMASKCALSIQDTKSFRIICDQVLRYVSHTRSLLYSVFVLLNSTHVFSHPLPGGMRARMTIRCSHHFYPCLKWRTQKYQTQ